MNIDLVLNSWNSFKESIGVIRISDESDYVKICGIIHKLLDEIGENEEHPFIDIVDYLSYMIDVYENKQETIPDLNPNEVLRFLMDQHNLKQKDLSDCAPQCRISEILNGKRSISKQIAKKLSNRFNVKMELFL